MTMSMPMDMSDDNHANFVPNNSGKRKFGFLQKYRVELPEAIRTVANSRGLIPLNENYKPTPHDIVCGRGRGNYNCEGNILFRNIVSQYTDQYLQSESKAAKTLVLVQILEQVKCESNGRCRFIKQRPEDGMWCELGEVAAREKAGHAMRESIATRKKLNTSKRKAKEPMETITSQVEAEDGMDVDRVTPQSDVIFGQPVASLPRDEKYREGDSVLSAVGSSDFLACRSSEFLKKYG